MDPRADLKRRHHVDEKRLQRALKQAVRDAGITTMIYTHVLNRGGRAVVSPLNRR